MKRRPTNEIATATTNKSAQIMQTVWDSKQALFRTFFTLILLCRVIYSAIMQTTAINFDRDVFNSRPFLCRFFWNAFISGRALKLFPILNYSAHVGGDLGPFLTHICIQMRPVYAIIIFLPFLMQTLRRTFEN